MIEFVVIAVVGGVLLAGLVMTLIWAIVAPAVGNLIDWVTLTFGNPEAVERVKRERGWTSEEDEQ